MTQRAASGGHDSQTAVIAALSYLFPPVVPAVVLFTDIGGDAGLRRHALHALFWTVGFVALLGLAIALMIWLVRVDFLAICLAPVLITLPFVPGAIWAKRAYMGQPVTIRVLSPLAEAAGRRSAGG